MHDLVYDLARSVMDEELIVYNANKVRSTVDQKNCRYALLTNCSKPLKISTILPAKLRALHFQDCSNLGLHGGAFSFAKCLRVLDLTESSTIKFPDSIGQLKQLRFLIAPEMKNHRFPKSITGLSKLQYLDLHGCSEIVKLPESLGNLKNLLHLDLCDCSHLKRLPQDVGNLTQLQHLNLSGCSRINELPESFGKLTNLMHLDLSRCSCVRPLTLNGLTKLKYLNLSESLEDKTEAKICINYISTLTNLEHLDLSSNDIDSLPQSIGNLKMLRTLDLSCCFNLMSLPESIGSIHSLEKLLVHMCSNQLKQYIRQFQVKSALPHFVVRPNDGDSGSNLHQLEGINPKGLEISCLENVRLPGEAEGVGLCAKENLSKLTFHWTMKADRVLEDMDVLGELAPPSGLKHLELEGYCSLSFLIWLMGVSHFLPNLVSIRLQDLPKCNNLPPLGQLPNLENLHLSRLSSITKINGDFCGGKGAFRRLSEFTLQDMEGLEEWNTTYCGEDGIEELMFPMLDGLDVESCPKLRLKPCPPIFRKWTIDNSDEVLDSGEDGGNFSHFYSSSPRTRLYVRSSSYCGSWRLLRHLPTLQALQIDRLDAMTRLPESMRQLAYLRSLGLYYCNCISMLPEWFCDLKSLETLSISGCERIKALPSCIQQLTTLQKLRIVENFELTQWCQSGKNWTMLAHIKYIEFVVRARAVLC